jgi:hypothetical protein
MRVTIVWKKIPFVIQVGTGPELFPPDLPSSDAQWKNGDELHLYNQHIFGAPDHPDPVVRNPHKYPRLPAGKSAYREGFLQAKRENALYTHGKSPEGF